MVTLINEFDREAAIKRNSSAIPVAGTSVMGIGLHAGDPIGPIEQLIRLRDNELLMKQPAVLAMVSYLRKNWDWAADLKPVIGTTRRDLVLNGFKQVAAACGIGPTSSSWRAVIGALERAGVGTAIEIVAGQELEASYELTSASEIALTQIEACKARIDSPDVLCINGSIEKLSTLHRMLNFAAENKRPLVVAATGFSREIRQTIQYNNANGKLEVILLSPRPGDVLAEFAIPDLASLSGAVLWEEIIKEYPTHSCGRLFELQLTTMGTRIVTDPELVNLWRARLTQEIGELPLAAAVLSERRRNLASGNRLTIRLPSSGIPGASHIIDEVAVLLSLWSSFIKDQHFLAPDGLHSIPVSIFNNARMYISETFSTIDSIGVYVSTKKV